MKKLAALVSCAASATLLVSAWGLAPVASGAVASSAVASSAALSSGTASSRSSSSAAPAAERGNGKGKGKKGKRWKAYHGPYFNNPHVAKDRYRIERRLLDTLKHVPSGETVRIALYSFDRMPVAKAIVAAHKRGVRIQLLLNDHWENAAMKVVRAELGANRWAKSFIYKCKSGCRTLVDQYRNLHSKFYTFTKAGRSEDVLVVGSHNFTLNADRHQWNDAYFMSGNQELFRQFVALFKDMKHDYSSNQPPMYFCGTPVGAQCDDSVDKYTNWAFPKRSTKSNDLVLDMLNKIQCLTPDGLGGETRTKLELSMHTMRGARGNYLASAIRQKYAEGCDFRVSYGLIGYETKQILGASTSRGRIPLRSTGLDYHPDDDFDLNGDGDDDVILDYYTHQKYFVIDGTYNGIPNTKMVLTGSSNWASLGTAQDEVFFTVHGGATVRKYEKNFDLMWGNGKFSRNAYTTTYTDFRTLRMVRSSDGTMRQQYVTVRQPVTTVEPDGHRAGGPNWEGD